MVVAGLVMSAGKERAFGEHTRERIEGFWETLDEVLNILLFAFIGLDVLLTPTAVGEVLAGLLMIVVALVARFVSVALPMTLVRRRDGYGPVSYTHLDVYKRQMSSWRKSGSLSKGAVMLQFFRAFRLYSIVTPYDSSSVLNTCATATF